MTRARLDRWALVLVCAILVAAAAWHLPRDLRFLWDQARGGQQTSRIQRLLAPTSVFGIKHPDVFPAAAAAMPPTARYAVVVGPNAPDADPGYRFAVAFAEYWLLPRREVEFAGPGEWILGYGVTPSSLGVPLERVVHLGPGILLAKRAA